MDNLARLKNILETVLEIAAKGVRLAIQIYQNVWLFLHTRIPILGALVKRHVKNPSTVFIDAAIFILVVYIGFGILGFIQIYPKKAETPLANNLSELYPFPAAKVDATLVWSHQFLARLNFLNTFSRQAPNDSTNRPPTDSELRKRVLEGLIEDRVIYLEAQKRRVGVTGEELKIAFDKQGDPNEIKQKVGKLYNMTLIEYQQILAEQILKEKVKNSVLVRWHLRHILTLDLASANEAKKQVATGKDFAEVAKTFSQDAKTVTNGGDIGFWRKGELSAQIAPGLEEAVAKLTVNQVSDPVQTQFGYQVIQLLERSDGVDQSYEDWYKEALAKHKVKRYIKI
ncbi:MAG: Foldase protein PrsA [Berkelbacteria bacterium GW2011_GWA2_46_7]|uniref:Foldase protein PrsA n=1 Tax=Berkelbacteria bacterium GW2011_GWA2_46_7 TaxID=1618335 RepID=A0A0G1QFS3_9BACT|nr:MAG: Foldase protein PrsA [Berkelbacteria bacterium GW2011_GWA2_46_7]